MFKRRFLLRFKFPVISAYAILYKSIKKEKEKKRPELMHFYPICDQIYLLNSNRECFSHSVTFVVHLHFTFTVWCENTFFSFGKKHKIK